MMDIPKPVKNERRICFAIAYFQTEEDAQRYSEWVKEQGFTYNGGFYHGRPCGREKSWDYQDSTLGMLFAVTH